MSPCIPPSSSSSSEPKRAGRKDREGGVIAIGLLEDNGGSSRSFGGVIEVPFVVAGDGCCTGSSKGSSSSPGRSYFSIERRRNGLNGGAKRGLRAGGDTGDGDCVECSTSAFTSMPGMVSSKSNSSSTN